MFAIWGSFSQPTVVDWFMAELQGFFRAYFFKSFLGSSLRIGMKGMSLNSLTCDPRHFLLRSGFFGDFDQHSRSLLLARAYDHFRSFCRTNRIACSQPPFKEHMVSWQNHMWCWFSEWFFETYDGRVRVKQDVCSDLCPTKLYKKTETPTSLRKPTTGGASWHGSLRRYVKQSATRSTHQKMTDVLWWLELWLLTENSSSFDIEMLISFELGLYRLPNINQNKITY